MFDSCTFCTLIIVKVFIVGFPRLLVDRIDSEVHGWCLLLRDTRTMYSHLVSLWTSCDNIPTLFQYIHLWDSVTIFSPMVGKIESNERFIMVRFMNLRDSDFKGMSSRQ